MQNVFLKVGATALAVAPFFVSPSEASPIHVSFSGIAKPDYRGYGFDSPISGIADFDSDTGVGTASVSAGAYSFSNNSGSIFYDVTRLGQSASGYIITLGFRSSNSVNTLDFGVSIIADNLKFNFPNSFNSLSSNINGSYGVYPKDGSRPLLDEIVFSNITFDPLTKNVSALPLPRSLALLSCALLALGGVGIVRRRVA